MRGIGSRSVWAGATSTHQERCGGVEPDTTIQGTGSYNMFNLNGAYDWDKYTVRFGVDNLLDEDPRIIGCNPGVDTNTDSTLPAAVRRGRPAVLPRVLRSLLGSSDR